MLVIGRLFVQQQEEKLTKFARNRLFTSWLILYLFYHHEHLCICGFPAMLLLLSMLDQVFDIYHWHYYCTGWGTKECFVFVFLQRLTIPSSCPVSFAELMRKCWLTEPRVSQTCNDPYVCFHFNQHGQKMFFLFYVDAGAADFQAHPLHFGVHV